MPRQPVRGFRTLNLLCAQDESILDEDDGREYSPGWSENFGQGPDGERLIYRDGEVVSDGSDGRGLVLRSLNTSGCYEVAKYLSWPQGQAYLVVATVIRNTCNHPVRFSFWTGEDSWIGRYASAEGDVGWYSGGLVRTETRIPGHAFRWGGLYDLGNDLLGRDAAAFSNAANFYAPDPGLPPPDDVYFANAFAHRDADIHPGRTLDDSRMTAFNLGWRGIVLGPRDEVVFRYATGRAVTGEPGDLPRLPDIPPEAWRFDEPFRSRPFREPPRGGLARGQSPLPVRFVDETIRMRFDPPWMEVEGHYHLRNELPSRLSIGILYPLPLDRGMDFPIAWEVSGVPSREAEGRGLAWTVSLEAFAETDVVARYTQYVADGADARYILTTTATWGRPLEHATYEVQWPASLEPEPRLSYPAPAVVEGDRKVVRFRRERFLPPRDLVLRPGVASPCRSAGTP
jgi:hypothetical protein